MGAQPAYSRYSNNAYDYAYEYDRARVREREREAQRAPRIQVVPGSGSSTASSALPHSVVVAARTLAVVFLVMALVGVARVALTSAAVTGSLQAQEWSNRIDDARAQGNQLEVAQSSLSNPARVKAEAKAMGMAAPAEVTTMELERDVVALDEAGNLSLSQSVRLATQSATQS